MGGFGRPFCITVEHLQAMKDQAIVCNIGHRDNEIQVDAAYGRQFAWRSQNATLRR